MPTSKALSNIIQTLIPEAGAEQLAVPGTGISLYLINADYPQHALANEVAQQLMERPLYWAFCWASGAAMARYLLQHPSVVINKTVVDFGSGSGVVAIAAAKAGAKQVIACDNDPNALVAIQENAQLNSVEVELADDFNQLQSSFDVLTAADVLYDRENLPWLDVFSRHAQNILIADSRIKNFQHPQYAKISQYESCTLPDLDESPEFRLVSVYSNDVQHQLGS